MSDVVQELQAQGYSPEQIQQFLSDNQYGLWDSYGRAMDGNVDSRQYSSNTLVSGNQVQDNLIKWQLELDSILERVEHMLRGDKPKFVNGNLIFVSPTSEAERVLNDIGVQEVMRVLCIYLNRNTILSNYDEFTINWKVYDFGKEVSDLIFMKYEAFGLDSLDKRKLYPIIVRELVDSVHSAYLRALHGGERDSLRSARSIQQSEQLAPAGVYSPQVQRKSFWNPLSWFGGQKRGY